jgi:hypothetical protein
MDMNGTDPIWWFPFWQNNPPSEEPIGKWLIDNQWQWWKDQYLQSTNLNFNAIFFKVTAREIIDIPHDSELIYTRLKGTVRINLNPFELSRLDFAWWEGFYAVFYNFPALEPLEWGIVSKFDVETNELIIESKYNVTEIELGSEYPIRFQKAFYTGPIYFEKVNSETIADWVTNLIEYQGDERGLLYPIIIPTDSQEQEPFGRYNNFVVTFVNNDALITLIESIMDGSFVQPLVTKMPFGNIGVDNILSSFRLVAKNKFSESLLTTQWLNSFVSGGGEYARRPVIIYNAKAYLMGGFDGITVVNDCHVYDIINDAWGTFTTGPSARSDNTAILYSGKIYYFGGIDSVSTYLNDVQEYNIGGDSWVAKTSGATGRRSHSAVEYNGKMYIYGGYNGAAIKDLWEYDITGDSWLQIVGLPGPLTGRYFHTAYLYQDKMYILGGQTPAVENTHWEYNITTDTWTQLANCPVTIRYHSSVVIGDFAYHYGGYQNAAPSNKLWKYDIANDTWTEDVAGLAELYWHAAGVYGDKFYVFGGYNDDITDYTDAVYLCQPFDRVTGELYDMVPIHTLNPFATTKLTDDEMLTLFEGLFQQCGLSFHSAILSLFVTPERGNITNKNPDHGNKDVWFDRGAEYTNHSSEHIRPDDKGQNKTGQQTKMIQVLEQRGVLPFTDLPYPYKP